MMGSFWPVENVRFAHDKEVFLNSCLLQLQSGKIACIHGSSGSGKSNLLKWLMRF